MKRIECKADIIWIVEERTHTKGEIIPSTPVADPGRVNCHLVYSQLVYFPFRLKAQPRFSGLR